MRDYFTKGSAIPAKQVYGRNQWASKPVYWRILPFWLGFMLLLIVMVLFHLWTLYGEERARSGDYFGTAAGYSEFLQHEHVKCVPNRCA